MVLGALSRETRDEGAEVDVCPMCGEHEALREIHGLRPTPLTSRPLSVEELLREDRLRRELEHRLVWKIDEDEARP
jgi:hypothetical protein